MTPERAPHGLQVGDVALDQIAVANRGAMAGDEIVEHHDRVAGAAQRLARVAADIAGAAGHQNAARISGQWRRT